MQYDFLYLLKSHTNNHNLYNNPISVKPEDERAANSITEHESERAFNTPIGLL